MSFNNDSTVSDYAGLFTPPSAPFMNNLSRDNVSLGSTTNLSLSVNYIPSKFSGFRNRKGGKNDDEPNLPKRGGGLQAFKTNEPRMPQGKGRLRWNKFKWILFVTNSLLMFFSIGALVVCLLTWFDVWQNANIIRTGNRPELILSTIAACSGVFTSLIGWSGILLNNRSFLAWYTFLTWITFAFLVAPGYVTYKRRTFNLEGKINAQWSRSLDTSERLRIQNELDCCGYFSPFVEATISQTCYARSILPGCKGPYLVFERKLLALWIKAVFSLVPLQILVMVAGLLCSNHITYRFGKGMMPEAYRLDINTMAVIMDNYANQLAEQYGADIASNILKGTPSKSVLGHNTTNASTPLDSPQHDIPMDPFTTKHLGTPRAF
ncbi:tetraspanin Tsp2 family [Phlegmacium glaucopus]|nr:tetraspanin Tsp2 family [Phlegmacium glaucopus]